MTEKSVFFAALEISDLAARSAYLDQACTGDGAFRQRVDELLAAHARSGSFMAGAVTGTRTEISPPASDSPGMRVGPYKLLEKIGEGGMGEVWVADQLEPIRRRVALKLIKPGMDSRSVLGRFEAERQALAVMDHPNIAKVFDAGTTSDGRPFFVMELVKGTPITEFCDARKLSPSQRLELFIPVCQAIQHAHMKGIIHRDIKPSNVLVALHDETAEPKVIDFGVAKAIGQQLTDKTIYTNFGALVGTPAYMAPEQATFNQLDVDTRADVYALGVLLYEMLAGSPPIEKDRLKLAALDEVLRIVREEEPPRPSHRVSTSLTKATIAETRQSDPIRLTQLMRRELDWIVMKALEKDRTRRYQSASTLAKDIQRYLAGDAVEACPPTLAYRLRKVARKRRSQLVAGAVVCTALIIGAFGLVDGFLRAQAAARLAADERDRAVRNESLANDSRAEAERERERAEEEKRSAQAVRDFLQHDLLGQASTYNQAEALRLTGGDFAVKSDPTVNELLDRAAAQLTPEKIESKFPNMPLVQAEVLKTVGASYLSIDQERKALELLNRAVDLYRTARGPDDPRTLAARQELAMTHLVLGRLDEGRRLLESVRDDRVRVLGPHHHDTFDTQLRLATFSLFMRREAEAVTRFTELREEARAHFGPDDFDTLVATGYLGCALRMVGRGQDAVRELEVVREAMRRLKIRPDHPAVQAALYELSLAYRAANRQTDSFALLEEVLTYWKESGDPYNPATWVYRHELGWNYLNKGENQAALSLFEQNQKVADSPLKEQTSWEALYSTFMKLDRFEEAQARIQNAHDVLVKHFGTNHRSWGMGRVRARMGFARFRLGLYAEAEPLLVGGYNEMVENISQRPNYDQSEPAATNRAIIDLYKALNKPDEVEKWQALRSDGGESVTKPEGSE